MQLRTRSPATTQAGGALACVIGSIELVRPLGIGGIRCAVAAPRGDAACYSRYTGTVLPWVDPWSDPDGLLDVLVRFAASQPTRPVLYYEGDWDLLLISRRREQLAEFFRFVIADAALVEDLVDKARFQGLAERLSLPTPATQRLSPADHSPSDVDLRYPIVIKPVTRQGHTWEPLAGAAKAVAITTPGQLTALWPRLAHGSVDVLAQELVPGPETAIESYHVYVDDAGEIAAEFTGRKVRTYPPAFGYSTALVITHETDVLNLGRDIVRRLDLRGVGKLDFKRAADGRLYLLEINPRFTLWHHSAAIAGVNIPALVYRDLTGLPRGPLREARAGVRWCYHMHDARAAMEQGMSLTEWLPWALRCECKSVIAWNDPMPVVGGAAFRLSRRLRRLRGVPRQLRSDALRRLS